MAARGGDSSCGAPPDDKSPPVRLPTAPIDAERCRYPSCVVWTPLPPLTWLLPFMGHVGIADASGVIHDFAGSYYVSIDSMAFGRPTKYLQLDPTKASTMAWDDAVLAGSQVYGERAHNILFDNCHSHTAYTLSLMGFDRSNWNAWKIGFLMFWKGRYTGFGGWLKTNLPAIIIWAIVIVVSVTTARTG